MSDFIALNGLRPTHPGELLREDVLPALGKTREEVAALLHLSRQTLQAILAERRPVTPSTALRLGRLLGNNPEFWLTMQQSYDLATVAAAERETLEQIHTLEAA